MLEIINPNMRKKKRSILKNKTTSKEVSCSCLRLWEASLDLWSFSLFIRIVCKWQEREKERKPRQFGKYVNLTVPVYSIVSFKPFLIVPMLGVGILCIFPLSQRT